MKDTKRFYPLFAFYDRTGIERYLEEKAEKGWMLEKITGFGWKFRKTVPEKVHFAVTYFPKASAFDPEPTEEAETFREFCEHTGWILAADNAQMQVYYNENDDPVHIETDPTVELGNIHSSAKKSFLPSYYILAFNGLLQAVMFFIRLKADPVEILVNNINLLNLFCWVMMLVLCFTEIYSYFSWLKKAKKAAEDGRFVETRSRSGFQLFVVASMLIALGCLIASLNDGYMLRTIIYTFFGVIGVTMMVVGLSNMMKKMKVSKGTNGFVTFASSILFSFALAGVMIWIVVSGTGSLGHEPVSSYKWGLFDIEVYDDPIPLKLEDLDPSYDTYGRFSYELYHSESVFAERYDCAQEPHIMDSDNIPSLRYTVYKVKFSPVFDILAELIYDELEDNYIHEEEIIASLKSIDPTPFLAKEAYGVYYRNDEPINRYLIIYPKNIVEIRTEWELGENEMNVIGQKLGVSIR